MGINHRGYGDESPRIRIVGRKLYAIFVMFQNFQIACIAGITMR